MRCFIAVEVKGLVAKRISDALEELRKEKGIKLVPLEALHFTLAFLGEITEEKAIEVKEALKSIKMNAFEVFLEGSGFFPSEARPRILWAGVSTGAENFFKLREAISKRIVLTQDNFKPHVTLARIKHYEGIKAISKWRKENEKTKWGQLKVNQFHLKKSSLTERGSFYENIADYSLV